MHSYCSAKLRPSAAAEALVCLCACTYVFILAKRWFVRGGMHDGIVLLSLPEIGRIPSEAAEVKDTNGFPHRLH